MDEISGTVPAAEIMRAYLKHVLRKPSPLAAREVVLLEVVLPDAEFQCAQVTIDFLMLAQLQ